MLGEDKVPPFRGFSGSAVLLLALKNLVLLILASVALFSVAAFYLMFAAPQTLAAVFSGLIENFAISAFVLMAFLGSVSYWYSNKFFESFRFAMSADYFFSRKGVITPSYTLTPYKNIQDVHVDQGLLEKLFGIATVRLYTATYSARGSDFVPGLSRKDAEKFKAVVFQRIRGVRKVAA